MRLNDILNDVEVRDIIGDASVDIADIAYDSRKVKAGTCFVAIRGERADGHDYINDAVKNGARAIVSERRIDNKGITVNIIVKDAPLALAKMSSAYFGNPSGNINVIGITGTNGKTTISYLAESVLVAAGKVPGVVGTVSWRFCGKVLPAPNTTPFSYDLQRLLSDMRGDKVTDVVMEVSSHALDQKRAACVDLSAAVFTNLTRDHLDYHRDIEEYFIAKQKLFTEYLPASSKQNKISVVNVDDAYGRRLFKVCGDTGMRTLKYGFENGADVKILSLNSSIKGNEMKLGTPWGNIEINSKLKGRFNVSNVLAVVALMGGLGYPLNIIKKGVESLNVVPGRFEDVPNKKGVHVFVDYSHTPDALKNVLSTLKEISTGRIITVFGCGGDRDRGKRPIMGEIAVTMSDKAIITSDNPRSENPLSIISDILEGVKNAGRDNYVVEEDRSKAITLAVSEARSGDAIMIAGKGHENYQIIGKEVRHFDDREEAIKCLSV